MRKDQAVGRREEEERKKTIRRVSVLPILGIGESLKDFKYKRDLNETCILWGPNGGGLEGDTARISKSSEEAGAESTGGMMKPEPGKPR